MLAGEKTCKLNRYGLRLIAVAREFIMDKYEFLRVCDEICGKYQSENDCNYVETAQDILKIIISSIIKIEPFVITPLWVEIYYGTGDDHGDSHYKLKQMNRYDKLYFHETGRGGVDLVISSKEGIAWSILIKACKIDGENYGQLALRRLFREKRIPDEFEWNIGDNQLIKGGQHEIKFAKRIRVKCYPDLPLSCYLQGIGRNSSSQDLYTIYRYVVTHPEKY